jgi:hypothetical protein
MMSVKDIDTEKGVFMDPDRLSTNLNLYSPILGEGQV